MGQQIASTFGPNGPSRIAGTTVYLSEEEMVIPGLPWYQPIIPFTPQITDGAALAAQLALSGGVASEDWKEYATEKDITFYQGDDVMISIVVHDDELTNQDMSAWEWHAQVRAYHNYKATLIHEFSCTAEFVPADTEKPDSFDHTVVTLYLPRHSNSIYGEYEWEMYSVAPWDFSAYTKPDGWPDDEVWPPTTALKTWVYGDCTILPRASTTDELPHPVDDSGGGIIVIGQGWVVGPNGRVP